MKKLILGNPDQVERNCYFWNSFAGLVNASEAIILSMIITRVTGVNEAGIISIAFAIGNLLVTIGKFGVRSYQVTDTQNNYTFADYFWLRIITTFMMVLVCIGYVFVNIWSHNYTFIKAIVILSICGIYVFESIEDVFWGQYQKKGRLDIGGRIFSYRWILTIIVFCLTIILTREY